MRLYPRLISQATEGFTLLELSVVLALIGIITGGSLMGFAAYVQSTQYNTTVSTMNAIERTLQDYSVANGRIPCPANLTCTSGQLNYGAEGNCASTTASCTSGTTGVNNLTDGVAEGGVPTRALKMPDSYQYDGWGRRLRYAAVALSTTSGSVPVANNPCSEGITVNDSTGAARSTSAIYALISHGQNGHGAYTAAGTTMVNAGSDNTDEQTNCHCDVNANATTYAPTYVEKLPTANPTDAANVFDDVVTFKENWQLQTYNNPLATAAGYTTTLTPPGNGLYYPGTPITFTATFASAVTVTGTPQLDLSLYSSGYLGSSGTAAYATYASGSGTTALTFTYSGTLTDWAENGLVVTSPIDLNGGTISSSAICFSAPSLTGVEISPSWWPKWFGR